MDKLDKVKFNGTTYEVDAPSRYKKPSTGIPKSDLASAVQTSLGKADSAIQSHQSLAEYRKSADQDTIDSGKVDKVSGKGLSTNDYTTAEKTKLAGIATGAEVNVQSDWNATSGDAFIKNKPTIPTKTSDLINDSGFVTSVVPGEMDKEYLDAELAKKQDTIEDLEQIREGANIFSLSSNGGVINKKFAEGLNALYDNDRMSFSPLRGIAIGYLSVAMNSGKTITPITKIDTKKYKITQNDAQYQHIKITLSNYPYIFMKDDTEDLKIKISLVDGDDIVFTTDSELDLSKEYSIISYALGEGSTSFFGSSIGKASLAYGETSVASGNNSVALGKICLSSANDSFSVGLRNIAAGPQSAAFGSQNIVNGSYGFVCGTRSVANAGGAMVMGQRINADGVFAFATGNYNNVYNRVEHASGQYNKSTKTSATFGNAGNTSVSHGIGTSEATRKNAFEVMENGDAYLLGVGGYDGTNSTSADSKTIQTLLNDSSLWKHVYDSKGHGFWVIQDPCTYGHYERYLIAVWDSAEEPAFIVRNIKYTMYPDSENELPYVDIWNGDIDNAHFFLQNAFDPIPDMFNWHINLVSLGIEFTPIEESEIEEIFE